MFIYLVAHCLHAGGHLLCGLLGVTSPCLSRYLHNLGRILLYCVLCADVNWVAGGVGEDTAVRCGDAGVHLDHFFLLPPPPLSFPLLMSLFLLVFP